MIVLLALAAHAADPCTIVTGAEVWFGPGDRKAASIVIVGDRIAAAGSPAGLDAAKGTWQGRACTMVAVSGLVTPGFTDPVTQLGDVEISQAEETVDYDFDEKSPARPFRAALDVADAYNPRSSLIPIARREGITSAVVVPAGGQISGRSAWVDLTGSSQEDAIVKAPLALHANLRGPSKAEALDVLEAFFEDAVAYRRNPAAFDRGRFDTTEATRRDLEAAAPVLDGRIPLVVEADRASDLEAIVRLTKRLGIRLVVSGGAEAWMIADQLAAAKVTVIIDPFVYGLADFDSMRARRDNAALLEKAGVRVLVSSFSAHNARRLRELAGNAVREGMSHDAALVAVTRGAADTFGVADHGRVAPGQIANLVVWKGAVPELHDDPFDPSTGVTALFIRGKSIPLTSRQTELFDRYRTLPGTPAAVPLPAAR
jgi:imidazolonepropionase-like amidohydrolase